MKKIYQAPDFEDVFSDILEGILETSVPGADIQDGTLEEWGTF